MLDLLLSSWASDLFFLVLTVFVGIVIKKFKFSDGLEQATRDLMAAVNNTWEIYVREIKKSKSDGKLTEDEKKIAREMAWQKAKEIAGKKGSKFLAKLGKEKGMQMIGAIVSRVKKGK